MTIEHKLRRLISEQQPSAVGSLLRGILAGCSLPYAAAVRIRNLAFEHGCKKVVRVSVPVISVGNLTTGGTGKTPVVAMLVQMLQRKGRRPGIVSRGYRADASGFNDEKRVLDQLCPNVPHLQNAARVVAAEDLIRDDAADVLVMDDGFQHRRMHRDLDIVLIDATCPFGYGNLLPRGFLREPVSSLKRAQLVFITRADLVTEESLRQIDQQLLQHAPALSGKIFRLAFRPTGLVNSQGEYRDLKSIAGSTALLMSGIGNTDAFRRTCESAGLQVVGQTTFADHHHYCQEDLNAVAAESTRLQAELVITTLKDLVKLKSFKSIAWAIQITSQLTDEGSQLAVEAILFAAVTRNLNN